jgi:hypothetical protein
MSRSHCRSIKLGTENGFQYATAIEEIQLIQKMQMTLSFYDPLRAAFLQTFSDRTG